MFSTIYKIFHKNAGLNTSEQRSPKLIVSLTTIPPRIKKIQQVLIRILEGSVRPDKLIVYLGDKEFKDKKLPLFLRILMKDYGVEVRFVEDIGPHTKYFYAMKDHPNDIIITVDDDIRYPNDLVEELYTSYKKHPKAVSARRCHLITFDEQGGVKKYKEWKYKYSELIDTPSMLLFPTGVGGVLYPPHLVHPETFNIQNLKKLSLKNDDIWLKFMEVMNKVPVVMTKPFVIKHVKGSQKVALNQENVTGSRNDVITKDVLNEYNEFFGKDDTLIGRMRGL